MASSNLKYCLGHERVKSVKIISHHVTWKQKPMTTYVKPIFDFMASVRHKKLKAHKKLQLKNKCSSICKCEEKINRFHEIEKTKEYKIKMNVLTEQQKSYIDRITEKLQNKMHGEEFTIAEKLMCLSIYNKSENLYNYLCTLIPLPDNMNLKKFRKSIPFDAGVTSTMAKRLLKLSTTMNSIDKIVILMLGSFPIEPHLHYSGKLDKIIGYEDWGYQRDYLAEEAFVFAIRGIESNWFLPVAYSFADEEPKISRLVRLFKQVVQCVNSAGFTIVACVSDKNQWYEATLEKLQIETMKKRGSPDTANFPTILIQGVEIVPLYNCLDLLTDFRNKLHLYDLEYFVDLMERPEKWDHDREQRITNMNTKKPLLATWKHIETMHSINDGKLKVKIPPLWNSSVGAKKLNKVNFDSILNVFNEKVANCMDKLAIDSENMNGKKIPPEGFFTSFILHFLDKLCLALMGGSKHDDNDPIKKMKTVLTDGSFHQEFFEVAKIYLQHMRFVDNDTRVPIGRHITCLNDLIITINGYQVLWQKLREMDFHFVKTENFNSELIDDFLYKYEGATCLKFCRDFKNYCYLDIKV
ncbi:uncharacterized protein LOC122502440 [Leptopilina heterotoma]|uniref:uncharacterized protein LOC122502440 n=1 Tax=Leptopilina heterotoma TaxID=63436 RepID=UPI001CA9C13F|nr:uncharacterized protein LOC122502440 [Leptopilina heterotoma]